MTALRDYSDLNSPNAKLDMELEGRCAHGAWIVTVCDMNQAVGGKRSAAVAHPTLGPLEMRDVGIS